MISRIPSLATAASDVACYDIVEYILAIVIPCLPSIFRRTSDGGQARELRSIILNSLSQEPVDLSLTPANVPRQFGTSTWIGMFSTHISRFRRCSFPLLARAAIQFDVVGP